MYRILFISLGCDKNRIDSELMLGLLNENKYEITDREEDADIIIINTCCFIDEAKEESINTILSMAEYKNTGSCRALIVTGCLAERYKKEILEEIPEVDAILGTASYDRIAEACDEVLKGMHPAFFSALNDIPKVKAKRIVTTGGHYACLKIAEGCGKHCTYCIIPKVRGAYRSRPMEELVCEAQELAADGVRELIIVAQETTLYGVDLYGEKKLPQLLQRLCAIPELKWLRLQYCYPEEITQELIDVMQKEQKICKYIDMPIQHIDDLILKRMGRRTSKADIISIIKRLRSAMPDIAVRTTLITGFPGETKDQHEELKAFIKNERFDRLGVFTYSQEEDTPAASYPGQLDEDIKVRRRDELMQLQQKISEEKSKEMTGRVLEVVIDGKLPDEGVYIGRTYRDAPDVDGYIFVESNDELMSGCYTKVIVTGSSEYDLTGVTEDESTE